MNNNTTTAYKCVKRSNGALWSYVITEYSVTYTKNTITFPLIGELFVFETLTDARNFYEKEIKASTHPCLPILPIEIWKVEVTNAHRLDSMASPGSTLSIKNFWMNKMYPCDRSTPNGTLGCTSVKLLEKIEAI